ncbi:MAG TPA: hypothetical protein VFD22_08240 [Gemmatimonadaceae bacterium]|nr:hypothetical protein [Gemmatimonadaceae bacterium]
MTGRALMRWSLSALVTALLLAAVARLSGSPVSTGNAGASRLRLSWTARPERIETCRTLSQKELEEREEHMRLRVECEGRFATYALKVFVGEQLVHSSVVHGAGLRNDRPIFLLRDIDVAPGTRRVLVSFTRREKTDGDSAKIEKEHDDDDSSGIFRGRAEREREERSRRARAAIPPKLLLDSIVSFHAGDALVLTFDSERGRLLLLSESDAGSGSGAKRKPAP